jgi:FMN phosphatase YigB (HAD superfamily)
MVSPLEIPPDVEAVLLDVGNVLASDYWESLLLTPGLGLADRFGLDRIAVGAAGAELWEEFCRAPAREDDYWSELSEKLGTEIEPAVRRELAELPERNPLAAEILDDLHRRGARIGLMTDNTSFWFPKQSALIGFDEVLDEKLILLSYEQGVSKSDRPGLMEVAAERSTPASTLVVDDREHNLALARELGFQVLGYSMEVSG